MLGFRQREPGLAESLFAFIESQILFDARYEPDFQPVFSTICHDALSTKNREKVSFLSHPEKEWPRDRNDSPTSGY